MRWERGINLWARRERLIVLVTNLHPESAHSLRQVRVMSRKRNRKKKVRWEAQVAKTTEERAEWKAKWQMLPGNRLEAGLQGYFIGSTQRLYL